MTRTTHISSVPLAIVATAALTFGACTARTDAPEDVTAPITEPSAMVDAGVPPQLADYEDADETSKTNPLAEPAFRAVLCGDQRCDADQRCCRATGQCFPADCPDCCDGAREGYFGDGPDVFDMHRGPADDPIRGDGEDDTWIEAEFDPDEPDPAE